MERALSGRVQNWAAPVPRLRHADTEMLDKRATGGAGRWAAVTSAACTLPAAALTLVLAPTGQSAQ
jgi:hypothetical protein